MDRTRAHAFQQRRDGRGVAQARAMVHVVGAEPGAHQLLEQVGLFVGALGGTEAGQRVADPTRIADFFRDVRGRSSASSQVAFAENLLSSSGIDVKSACLGASARRIKRLGQPLRAGRSRSRSGPSRTGGSWLAGPSRPVDELDDLVVLHVVGQLAADAAERAHRIDGLVGLRLDALAAFFARLAFHERAGRAGLHALAAGDAGGVAHRVVEVEHDLGRDGRA